MIQFKGELSKKTIKHICKCQKYIAMMVVGLTISITLVPAYIFFAFNPPETADEKMIFWILVYCTVVVIVGTLFSPYKCNYPDILPTEITIYDSGVMVSIGKEFQHTRKINRVKMVKDYGEWYEIIFSKKFFRGYFVCQKDLITRGSIREFEKLFESKIIKVENKNTKR